MGCQPSTSRQKIHPLFFDPIVSKKQLQEGGVTTHDQSPLSRINLNSGNLVSFAEIRGDQRSPAPDDTRKKSRSWFPMTVNERELQYRVRTSIQPVKAPSLSIYLDKLGSKLYVLDLDACEWQSKDLTQAQVVLPTTFTKSDDSTQTLLKSLDQYSFVAVSPSEIHFIGPEHYQYDLLTNTFIVESQLLQKREIPVLCVAEEYIYSFSGLEDDQFSRRCQRYNLLSKEWSSLDELPRPHIKGSALAYQANFADESRLKMLVIGGLKLKESIKPTNSASIYDCKANFWRVVDLQFKNFRTPVLSNIQMIITVKNELYVFGKQDEESWYYRFEPEDNAVTVISELKASGELISVGTKSKSGSVNLITTDRDSEGKIKFEMFESDVNVETWSKCLFKD